MRSEILEQLGRVEGSEPSRGRLRSIIETDPVLRLHLALDTPSGPWPMHPAHPDGTVAENLATAKAGHAVHVAMPLVVVFRRLLDRHVTCLRAGRHDLLAVELTRAGRPTGRLVLLDPAAATAEPDQATVTAAAEDLYATTRTLLGEAADRVYAEELRHLADATAVLLGGHHPLRRHVHCVPAGQDQLLRDVLDRVEEAARVRRADPDLPVPAVVLDLDLCALVPHERTLLAARVVSAPCHGAPRGIPSLADPARLPVLPTYVRPAWERFLDATALRDTHPEVDWNDVYDRYCRAFFRPWQQLRTDRIADGLVRFVRDVEDVGGVAVFNTGRRDRVRDHTTHVLAAHGLGHVPLLTLPDDRTRPVAELKVENLRSRRDLHIVAVFDDLADNRAALAAEFPQAMIIGVELAGYATDQPAGAAPAVATFERRPRPANGELSHAHSIAELPLADLRPQARAWDHAVHLTAADSRALVSRLVHGADTAADRTATAALRRLDTHDPVALLHHVLTRRQFWRGSRAMYTLDHAERDIRPFVTAGEPVRVMVLGFPVKHAETGLKAVGTLPDLAELGALVRFRELCQAARGVYSPGVRITVLTDGSHYRDRPRATVEAYVRALAGYADLVDLRDVEFAEVDDAAATHLGADVVARRGAVTARFHDQLSAAFAGIDLGDDPLGALDRISAADPAQGWPTSNARSGRASMPTPRGLFRSLLHSVPVPSPDGIDQFTWSRLVHADPYAADPVVPGAVRAARRRLLRDAWDATLQYLAAWHADRELHYDDMFPANVRLTFHTATPGRCGFIPLGGSGLSPWHGTGAVSARGEVSTDFVVSLLDQGFVPVHSPLLGPDQPWFMVPATAVRGDGLDPDYATSLRLRRR